MLHSRSSWLLCVIPLLLASCGYSSGPEGPPPRPTGKVGGVVMIDGEPAPLGQVVVKLYPKGQGRNPQPGQFIPQAIVGQEGKFAFSTFQEGDGVEPGDYVLTMEWLRLALGGRFGPDKFRNNFNNPVENEKDAKYAVSVTEGGELVIPTIEVDTSSLKKVPMHPYATGKGKGK